MLTRVPILYDMLIISDIMLFTNDSVVNVV